MLYPNMSHEPYESDNSRPQDLPAAASGAQQPQAPDAVSRQQTPPVTWGLTTSSCFAQEPGAKRRSPRKSGKGAGAGLVAACMVFSMLFGFGGGYLASRTGAPAGSDDSATASQGTSLEKQSVLNTSSSGENLSVAEIAAKAMDSVVEINTAATQRGQTVSVGAGSGVILTSDGYIVTNNHVVSDATQYTVRTRNGETYNAALIGTDAQTDLAVLKIEATGLTPAVLGDSDKLTVGEIAVAIGNPLGELGGTVTDGIISALAREVTIGGQSMTLLQTNAAINPGNSGGGLFNGAGELIGVVNAKSTGTDVEGLGFAIPINTAKPVIEDLMKNGFVQGRVTAGFETVDLTELQNALQYGVYQTGIYVLNVGTNADGFQRGDLLVSIDGRDIASMSDYNAVLESHGVGDRLTTVILRSGRQMTLTLTLQQATGSNTL